MAKTKPVRSNYWVPMVEHTFRVLELFYSEDAELNLQEISSRAGISKTSAFRILFTLDKLGYVSRADSTRKYRLGMKILEVARNAIPSRKVVQLARPHMKDILNLYDVTVNLAVFQDSGIRYIEIMESSQMFRVVAEVGSRVPLHSTALGKCIAAFLPVSEVQELLRQTELTRFTPKTISTHARFFRALSTVRKKGYGVDNEETELGAFCLAVPLLKAGHPVAGISVSGPVRHVRPRQREIISELKRIAESISRQLSGS